MSGKYIGLKFYFAGSISGGRDDTGVYLRIVKELKKYGKVLTEHVADPSLLQTGEEISDKEIHDRDIEWLQLSDVVVAEVTQTSLGVGYEIGRAVEMNKRILCLFRPGAGKKVSRMLKGGANKQLIFIEYEEKDIEEILKEHFSP